MTGRATELRAAGVWGASELITIHGAMSAIRKPNEIPADTRDCTRLSEACSCGESTRADSVTGREEGAETERLDTKNTRS